MELKDLKHIKLSHKDLLINLKNERFNSSILNLKIGKEKTKRFAKRSSVSSMEKGSFARRFSKSF